MRIGIFVLVALTQTSLSTQYCDDLVYGACLIYGDQNPNMRDLVAGITFAHHGWEKAFNQEIDLKDLALQYNLSIYLDNDNDFIFKDLAGYFVWPDQSFPEIHIALRDSYSKTTKCYLGYTIGHEILHFLNAVYGYESGNHSDPVIWVEGAFDNSKDLQNTIEFKIYENVVNYCN